MTFSLEHFFSAVRTILRSEVSGAARFMASFLLALVLLAAVAYVGALNTQQNDTLNSLMARFRTLLLLADEYHSLNPSPSNSALLNVDVAAVFAQVSENMSLGSRVNRITPDGRNQSVEINRLYAEELADLHKQLSSRGVKFIAAEIRALPSGKERLFSISAVIGPSNS